MKQKHLLSLGEYSRAEIEEIFELARKVKARPADYRDALKGKSLGMIFQKPSTRTRVSFEVGMFQLGGLALFSGLESIQIGRGETVADTRQGPLALRGRHHGARVRAPGRGGPGAPRRRCRSSTASSDLLHPCQALADSSRCCERRGRLDGAKLAYVGDGNNVCHALMLGAVKLGVAMSVASPNGYQPNPLILKSAVRDAQKEGTPPPVVTADPMEAVKGADVVSHGRVDVDGPGVGDARPACSAFQGFMVTPAMMAAAAHGRRLHALPAGAPGGTRWRRRWWTARSRSSSTRRRTACTSRRRC